MQCSLAKHPAIEFYREYTKNPTKTRRDGKLTFNARQFIFAGRGCGIEFFFPDRIG